MHFLDACAGRRGRLPRARRRSRLLSATLALLLLACVLATGASASPAGAGLTIGTAGPAAAGAKPFANSAPKVTSQPSNVTVEAPGSASFTSTASGTPTPTVQWEVSSDGGKTFSPIEGATSTTYTIPATSVSENGHQFRADFSNAAGSKTSNVVVLTVTSKPVVIQQPTDASAAEGHEAVFEAQASGSPAPTIQWEESTDGGSTYKSLSGQTATKLKFSSVNKTQDGWKFRALFKNVAGSVLSEPATLHVVELAHINQQPLETTVIEGQTASFTSTATGNPTPTIQWEVSTNSGATYAKVEGATSTTLSIPSTTVSESGNLYRAAFSNAAGTVLSNSAKLVVEGVPVVTEQPESHTVLVGGSATFEAAGTGTPTPTVQWQISLNEGASWSNVGGATTNTLTVSNAQLSESGHEYRAVFTNPAGTATSIGRAADGREQRLPRLRLGPELSRPGGHRELRIADPIPPADRLAALRRPPSPAAREASLALLAGGTVEAWGYNGFAQLGNEGPDTDSPIAVAGLSHVKAIAAGGNHSVALLRNGTVETWGDDENGQLGNGTKEEYDATPTVVEGLSGVSAVAAGQEHTLALLSNGTVMSWGNNERGQLGAGNTHTSDTPVAVKGVSTAVAIAANRNFSMALLSNGTVVSWGDDERGQLGNEGVLEKESEEGRFAQSPVPVEELSGVTAIAAGTGHALALLSNKTVVAWGDDREGELGNGTTEAMSVHPTPAIGLTGVTGIDAGEQDSVAQLENGTIETWGMNTQGSLGLGTHGASVDTPTPVTALGMVAGVSAGGAQMIAFGESLPSVTGISPSSGPSARGHRSDDHGHEPGRRERGALRRDRGDLVQSRIRVERDRDRPGGLENGRCDRHHRDRHHTGEPRRPLQLPAAPDGQQALREGRPRDRRHHRDDHGHRIRPRRGSALRRGGRALGDLQLRDLAHRPDTGEPLGFPAGHRDHRRRHERHEQKGLVQVRPGDRIDHSLQRPAGGRRERRDRGRGLRPGHGSDHVQVRQRQLEVRRLRKLHELHRARPRGQGARDGRRDRGGEQSQEHRLPGRPLHLRIGGTAGSSFRRYPVKTRESDSATQTGFSAPSRSNVSSVVICAPPGISSTEASVARIRTRSPTGSGAGKRTRLSP